MKIYKTKQKDILISFLKENKNKQFSVNAIADNICNAQIGKSTVYRLINQLTKEGYLRCFHDENSKISLYQYADKNNRCDHHFHLKCNMCKKIIHLECDHTSELKEHIASKHSFAIDISKTILYGYCNDCQKKGLNI